MFHESESITVNKNFSRNEVVGALQIGCGSIPITAQVLRREVLGPVADITGKSSIAINTFAEIHDGNRHYMILLPNSVVQVLNNKEVCVITSLVSYEYAHKIGTPYDIPKPLSEGQAEILSTPTTLPFAA